MPHPSDDIRAPDRPPEIFPTGNPVPMSDGMVLGIVVAVVASIGDFLIFCVPAIKVAIAPLFLTTCIAWLTASLGLFTIWLGLGGGRLYLRMLAAGGIGTVAILLVGGGDWSIQVFAFFVLFLTASALPFGLLYIGGVELVSNEIRKGLGRPELDLRSGQFSLRQLFGWMVAASLVASVARFAEIGAREFVTSCIATGAFSLIAVGTVYATLRPGRNELVALRIVILCASAIILVEGIVIALSRAPLDFEQSAYLAITAFTHASFMCFVLLLYRRLGYRLRRRPWSRDTATSNNAPAR